MDTFFGGLVCSQWYFFLLLKGTPAVLTSWMFTPLSGRKMKASKKSWVHRHPSIGLLISLSGKQISHPSQLQQVLLVKFPVISHPVWIESLQWWVPSMPCHPKRHAVNSCGVWTTSGPKLRVSNMDRAHRVSTVTATASRKGERLVGHHGHLCPGLLPLTPLILRQDQVDNLGTIKKLSYGSEVKGTWWADEGDARRRCQVVAGEEEKQSVKARRAGDQLWQRPDSWLARRNLLGCRSGTEIHPQQGKLLQRPCKYKVLYKH